MLEKIQNHVHKNARMYSIIHRRQPMKLKDYLYFNKISTTDFAEQINYQRSYLSAVTNGSRKCGAKLAKIIEKATNGQVTAKELLSKDSQ